MSTLTWLHLKMHLFLAHYSPQTGTANGPLWKRWFFGGLTHSQWPGKANMEGNFDAIFKCPEPSVAKSRALLPVLYSHKARNMQECPRSPQGAANKELNSNTDNCCLPLLCVCVHVFFSICRCLCGSLYSYW